MYVTGTAQKARLHRTACKRVNTALATQTDDLTVDQLRVLQTTGLVPASCCKPPAHALDSLIQVAADHQATLNQGTAELAGGDVQPLPVKKAASKRLPHGRRKSGDPKADRGLATVLADAGAQVSPDAQRCTGSCGQVKPVTSFPTVTRKAGPGRGTECRTCRDARREARAAG